MRLTWDSRVQRDRFVHNGRVTAHGCQKQASQRAAAVPRTRSRPACFRCLAARCPNETAPSTLQGKETNKHSTTQTPCQQRKHRVKKKNAISTLSRRRAARHGAAAASYRRCRRLVACKLCHVAILWRRRGAACCGLKRLGFERAAAGQTHTHTHARTHQGRTCQPLSLR